MPWTITGFAALAWIWGTQVEDKKPTPPPARIVVVGKSVGQILVSVKEGGKEQRRLVTLLELDAKTKLAVAEPPAPPPDKKADSGADPDLQRMIEAAAKQRTIAVEGWLSTTSDRLVIASVGGPRAPSIPLLIADRIIELKEENKKEFPPPGSIQVEGTLARVPVKLDDITTEWVLRVEPSGEIPLLFPSEFKVPDAGGKHRVTGAAAIRKGRLVVHVQRMEASK